MWVWLCEGKKNNYIQNGRLSQTHDVKKEEMEGVLMCLGVCIHMCESHDTNYVTAKLEVTTGQTNKYILTSASDY